jgi:antitoxin MazE
VIIGGLLVSRTRSVGRLAEKARELFFRLRLDCRRTRDYDVITMRAKIIKIGNSQGIRIPKLFLEQTKLGDEVELEAQDDQIIIRPVTYPRQGWDEAFQAMAERGDDQLLDDDLASQTRWGQEEWEW